MNAGTFVAGRFILYEPLDGENAYITSWDTWEEAAVAFPIEGAAVLLDTVTGREWRSGDEPVSPEKPGG